MSTSLLLRGGTVLTCDDAGTDHLDGDVLIVDGRIADVAAGRSTHPASADAEIVDVSGCVVFPGLVDAHQHVWEQPYLLQRPEMGLGEYFADFVRPAAGALDPDGLHAATSAALEDALRRGTTTTLDWCHAATTPDHARAAVAAGSASGARYVFGYGPAVALGDYGSDRGHPEGMELLAAELEGTPHPRVRMVAALRGPDLSSRPVWTEDIRRARAIGLPISIHAGTRRVGPGGVRELHGAGLLAEDVQVVHATDCSDDELRMLADTGARVVVPPVAELAMGTGFPPLRALADARVPFGLGIDTVLGAPAGMIPQLQAAWMLLRAGEWIEGAPPLGSTARDILRAGTIEGARACWIDDEAGSLEVGKHADLVVLRPSRTPSQIDEAYAQVVWTTDSQAIVSVRVAGVEVFPSSPKEFS